MVDSPNYRITCPEKNPTKFPGTALAAAAVAAAVAIVVVAAAAVAAAVAGAACSSGGMAGEKKRQQKGQRPKTGVPVPFGAKKQVNAWTKCQAHPTSPAIGQKHTVLISATSYPRYYTPRCVCYVSLSTVFRLQQWSLYSVLMIDKHTLCGTR